MKRRSQVFLITAGPTIEDWDPVRYLSNRSSGNTGIAIANAAAAAGYDVYLVSNISKNLSDSVKHIYVKTARDMFKEVKIIFPKADVFISAAAVADFRPKKLQKKIKKKNDITAIELVRNPDILRWAGKNKTSKFIVGFCLEDRMDHNSAYQKMSDKNCDMMILNTIANLNSKNKSYVMINKEASKEYAKCTAEEMADNIVKECLKKIL